MKMKNNFRWWLPLLRFVFLVSTCAQLIVEDVRLPQIATPNHYHLTILPIFEDNPRICGYVWINVTVIYPTTAIVLNAVNIIPVEVIVSNKTERMNYDPLTKVEEDCLSMIDEDDRKTARIRDDDDLTKNIHLDEEREQLVIIAKQTLTVGTHYQIGILYKAEVYDTDNVGFFRLDQKVDEKDCCKRWIGATQLEATHARKVFPCLDEPAFKATFDITVGHDSKLTALSNMPKTMTIPLVNIDNWIWDTYATTPVMSPYLVAFVLSELTSLETSYESIDGRNITIRLWSDTSKMDQLNSLKILVPNIMMMLEKYLRVPYALPKLDIVAIPGYDSARAMENWGLVVQSESNFLLDNEIETENTSLERTLLALTVVHELAHQWFGNLVTSAWWDDIWVNEGLSTLFENIVLKQLAPEMEADTVVVLFFQQSFHNDKLTASLPLNYPVSLLPTIDHKFDGFTYAKASAIFRMVRSFVGEEPFQNALRRYINQFKFKSANSTDLWAIMTQESRRSHSISSRMNVARIMKTWTDMPGYPVIHVKYVQDGSIQLTQNAFIDPDFPLTDNTTSTPLWWIPVSMTDGSAPSYTPKDRLPAFWLTPNRPTLIMDSPKTANGSITWLMLNLEYHGYYRVNYDEIGWQLLAQQLMKNYSVIPPINRAQLIDDVFVFGHSNLTSYKSALKLIEYLGQTDQELSYVRSVAAGHVGRIQQSIEDPYQNKTSKWTAELANMVETMMSYIMPQSQASREDQNDDFDFTCQTGEKPCVDKAIDLFRKSIKDTNPTKNKLMKKRLESAWCTALRHGGSSEWNLAWMASHQSDRLSERKRIIKAMGCTNDLTRIKRLLSRLYQPNIEQQPDETLIIFNSLAENPSGRRPALHFVMKNWSYLNKHFRNRKLTRTILINLTRKFASVQDLKKVTEFLDDKAKELGPEIIDLIVAKIKSNFRQAGLQDDIKLKYHSSNRISLNEL